MERYELDALEAGFLASVENALQIVLEEKNHGFHGAASRLHDAARHLCVGSKAKRARPLLTLCFGDALQADRDTVINVGIAAELVHSASLLHDDVIDEASVRRGKPSVNVHFSNSASVLAGNYVLTLAFSLLKNYPINVITEAIEVVAKMTKAAMAEIEIRGRLDVGLDLWQEIAIGKTGMLFAWCGQAIARVLEKPDDVLRFARVGAHIGAAFQMVDDLKDLSEHSALKDRCSDIRNKEPSYPIILAISSSIAIRDAFGAAWSNDKLTDHSIQELRRLVLKTGAIEQTCDAVAREIAGALEAFSGLENTNGGRRLKSWLSELYETSIAFKSAATENSAPV